MVEYNERLLKTLQTMEGFRTFIAEDGSIRGIRGDQPFHLTDEEVKSIEVTEERISLRAFIGRINSKKPYPEMVNLKYDDVCNWLQLEGAIIFRSRFPEDSTLLHFGYHYGMRKEKGDKDFTIGRRMQNFIRFHLTAIKTFTFVEVSKYKDEKFQTKNTYIRFGYHDNTKRGNNRKFLGITGTREPFHIDDADRRFFIPSHHPISTTELCYRMNCMIDNRYVRECSYEKVLRWLYKSKYIHHNIINPKSLTEKRYDQKLVVTTAGKNFGLVQITTSKHFKYNVYLSCIAQLRIVSHIEEILEEAGINEARRKKRQEKELMEEEDV